MLVAERHQKIFEVVNERGSIRVTELSQMFQVTEETIRRDLDKLENDRKLFRSHGGAVSKENSQPEIHHSEREVTNVYEKIAIASEAIKYIEPKDRIILDASTTAYYMAKSLPDLPLTVVTNSISVAMELAVKEKIQVISTGGHLLSNSLSYVGPLAERSLETYHVNKAFLSCKGIHLKNGISESTESQGIVKKKMIDIADTVFMLVDYSKFGIQAFAKVADLREMDMIITDPKTEKRYIDELREFVDVRQV
jgi:DeoR/GlpR family transcriptional regulator of sugar metabolism